MKRGSGVLLHISSLPSAYGIGDLGPQAYRFVDFLASAKQSYWQILPLGPSGTYLGNSPYNAYSAFAGNPLFISPELMIAEGFITKEEAEEHPAFPATSVDYHAVIDSKRKLLNSAYTRFKNGAGDHKEFSEFCERSSGWLDDLTLFAALKERFKEVAWDEWPADIRDRKKTAIKKYTAELSDRINTSKFYQYLFFRHWNALKSYCNGKNIKIIGDIPIYVSSDSADVWSHPALFKLDDHKKPLFIAGAPPDYFSPTGQRWGNPVYRWDVLKERGYDWWHQRIGHNLQLFDYIRIDHFRGFVGYWEIPAAEKTAVNGKWVEAPGMDFFQSVTTKYPNLPLIVEDLGVITPDVKAVIEHFGFPGMKVLLFSFSSDLPVNPYAPHNYLRNCVVYTGTHDNNTALGWFQRETGKEDKERVFEYLGHEVPEAQVPWELVRLALSSVADVAILSMPDILGLGEEARMNMPSEPSGNWKWRLSADQLTDKIAKKLSRATSIYARSN